MGGRVQPAGGAAWVRQRDEDAVAIAAELPHRVVEGDLPPEPLDRELADQQHDARLDDRELTDEPRRAERDLRWAGLAIARAALRLAGKALRDRRAIRQVVGVDPSALEPASDLRTRATGEWKTRGELDRAGCLADDHHAVGRTSRDDREGARDVARVRAARACADLAMEALKGDRPRVSVHYRQGTSVLVCVAIIDRLAVAWAAGFFDGEGSTYVHHDSSRQGYLRIELSLPQKGAASVPEALSRFRRAMCEMGRFGGPDETSLYWWRTRGRLEAFAALALLWNDLGAVKREQANRAIREVLDHHERRAFVSRGGHHQREVEDIIASVLPIEWTATPETDRAWAAGFLDGEGCFGLARGGSRQRGPDWYRVRASAAQHGLPGTPPEVLVRLQRVLGGRIERHGEPDDFKWVAEGGSLVEQVLERVGAHLGAVKRADAQRALAAFKAQVRLKGDGERCVRGHLYTYIALRDCRLRKVCLECARILGRRARARHGIAPRQFRNEARGYTE